MKCENCTEKCPQEELACEIAKGRMYATKEVIELQKELQSYKDAEEQGLLLRLPCKVGDTVWCIVSAGTKMVECTVLWIEWHRNGVIVFSLDGGLGEVVLAHLGKVWFLTLAEAEQALADMKGE